MFNKSTYPEEDGLISRILVELEEGLGANVTALYLTGSLVWGDYDPDRSDVDLVAILRHDLSPAEFAEMDHRHQTVVGDFPAFENRIEIIYISVDALRTFREKRSPIAEISPGEPFHFKDAGADWLINWYLLRQQPFTLYGPPPGEVIPPISHVEYLAWAKSHAEEWRDWLVNTRDSRPYQGYAILTMCRALYTVVNGEQASKLKAADWAMQRLPGWAPQIKEALRWRQESRTEVDGALTYPETVRTVNALIDLIVQAGDSK